MSSKISARDIVGTPVVLGRSLSIERIAWRDTDGLSFDVYDDATGACLTMSGSFDDHPGLGELEDAVRGSHDDTAACGICGELLQGEGGLAHRAGPDDSPFRCAQHVPAACFRCGKPVGTDGHLVGAAAAGDNPWCCNDCWDERLS